MTKTTNTFNPWPEIEAPAEPLGARVMVQLRRVQSVSSGGVLIPTAAKEHEENNTQVAKVVSVGALAFKDRHSLEPWPEGNWVEIGDIVRVPKYAGDVIVVKDPEDPTGRESVKFVTFRDTDLIAKYTDLSAFRPEIY